MTACVISRFLMSKRFYLLSNRTYFQTHDGGDLMGISFHGLAQGLL